MSAAPAPQAGDGDAPAGAGRDVLRFIVCGSVDDGKSTLVGRLIHDAGGLDDDRLAALRADSPRWGTQAGEIDFSLHADGLLAEREQRITIDVAHCYFATEARKFIVIDAPGHEQYTRNMVTGASNADLAVILVDVRKGVLAQTRRHALIVRRLDVAHVVLVVNKMDLVDYSQERFDAVRSEFGAFCAEVGIRLAAAVATSALTGENVARRLGCMPWHDGPPLLRVLETMAVQARRSDADPLRFPVQWVNRPDADFRGFAGTVAAGTLRAGAEVCVQPSGQTSRIRRIVTADGDLVAAGPGESVTITLADEIDVRRGDIVSALDAPAALADRLEASIVWLHEEPLRVGRSYLLKIASCELRGVVTSAVAEPLPGVTGPGVEGALAMNELGTCQLALDRRIAFDPFEVNRRTGGFIVIDPVSFDTVGAGMLRRALAGPDRSPGQTLTVDRSARAAQKGQRPAVLWFTGLSGAGKSTIANLVEARLLAAGRHSYLLDGDNVRRGLNRDLGFTEADRVENIRRVAEVARLLLDAGLVVLAAFISPFRTERSAARALFGDGEFIEVHVDTPLALAEKRDVKGLYRRARLGQLRNFTGIDSPYEVPTDPDLRIDTATTSAEAAADRIVDFLRARGVFGAPP